MVGKILKIFSICLLFLVVSCNSLGLNDIRKVEKGMEIAELIGLLGEPIQITIEDGYEEWTYRYSDHNGNCFNCHTAVVKIINRKVESFFSY